MTKIKIGTEKYRNLKRFINLFANRFIYADGMPTNGDLIAKIEATELTSAAQAEIGVKMIINDFIEMSIHWDFEKIKAFDAELQNNGVVTLTELRWQYSKHFARVLKRGKINSIEEYYLLKGVSDLNPPEMSGQEKEKLIKILISFEENFVET